MPMSTFVETYAELLALFNAVFTGTWSTVAANAGSPATNLYVSLHNADPGDGGSQTTNESVYTNYARVAVARSSVGFTCTLGSGATPSNVQNAASIGFAQCGNATGDTLTHWGIGLSSTGAGTLLAYGPIGAVAGPFVGWTSTLASPAVFTCPGYTPTLNDRISLYPFPQSGALALIPTAFTVGTLYYAVGVSGQTFELSATASGAAINGATAGSGILYKQSPLIVSSGVSPSFGANQLAYYKS